MVPARSRRCYQGEVARRRLRGKGAIVAVPFGGGEGHMTHPRWPGVKRARGGGNGGGTTTLWTAGTAKSCTGKATGVKLRKVMPMEKKGRERMVSHQHCRAENGGATRDFDGGGKF
jgi:hypothetical protein